MYHSNGERGQNTGKCELSVDHQASPTFKKLLTTGQSASETLPRLRLLQLVRQRHAILLRKYLYDNNPFTMRNRKASEDITQESSIP